MPSYANPVFGKSVDVFANAMQFGKGPYLLFFEGTTTDNTATKLKMNNEFGQFAKGGPQTAGVQSGQALTIALSTAYFIKYVVHAYNETDDAPNLMQTGTASAKRSAAGTVAVVATAVADTAFNTGGSFAWTANDTDKTLDAIVTGTSAKTIHWKVWAEIYPNGLKASTVLSSGGQ